MSSAEQIQGIIPVTVSDIIREIEESTTERTIQELDRTYKTVLDFVHEVQDVLDDPECDLTGACEADDIYVVVGEKGLD